MKKTGFNGSIYDFGIDYVSTDVDHIKDIHKYLMKKRNSIKMFRFIKQIFVSATMFFGCNLSSVNSLECVLILEIFNANSNDPIFYPSSIRTSKFSGSCNNTNNPYAKLCVPDVVKI